MKRIFVIILTLSILLGISDVAFAKHHHSKKAEAPNNKEDQGRKVTCLVKGVPQMVRTEGVCKDFNGTVVPEKTPPGATAVPEKKITAQKIESK